ncbi:MULTISPECIES: hypothetical protein [Pseudomonas]|uniref:hypothetical protein n=1 Tax=Pseudomonas TaxID=286 RepID=UPI00117AA90C|nr:hypothetical protein [Pseudomonas putida]TRO35402.1 hypothetical protein EQ845_13310 [Pseudomonas putida]
MTKRKIFHKTNLSIPEVKHIRADSNVRILPDAVPPACTKVNFGRNATNYRSFDFARWYGASIDSITYACHRQIERFLEGQDKEYSIATVTSYCSGGLRYFLDYCLLRAKAFERELTLNDITRDLVDGYLAHIAGLGLASTHQRLRYSLVKPVLAALGRRKLFNLIPQGDFATFPRNPFPNNSRKYKSETALSNLERKAFSEALRRAVKPIWDNDVVVTAEILALALLAIALHTGRNTTPLLEMNFDALQPHPKDDKFFLVLWKRRGHKYSRVLLNNKEIESELDSTPTVSASVERLIRRVMDLTKDLNADAPDELKGRVWLFRSRGSSNSGKITVLTMGMLSQATHSFVSSSNLLGSDGNPLRINISRLRKTFANRIFEMTSGNIAVTAAALGNTLQVADRNYLAPSAEARQRWRFMGEILVEELLNNRIGATHKATPVGLCSDPINGQYAPRREGATCMNFINCFRCEHYAVTSEDLFKLFSFYYRVLGERSRMAKRRWEREFAHIPRLIDSYIVAEGLRRGAFKAKDVESARQQARTNPHPFWSVDLISTLEVFA